MASVPRRRGTHVSVMLYDEGTCLVPGIVLGVTDDDRLRMLVRKSSGIEPAAYSFGAAREYVMRPNAESAERWATAYVELERAMGAAFTWRWRKAAESVEPAWVLFSEDGQTMGEVQRETPLRAEGNPVRWVPYDQAGKRLNRGFNFPHTAWVVVEEAAKVSGCAIDRSGYTV